MPTIVSKNKRTRLHKATNAARKQASPAQVYRATLDRAMNDPNVMNPHAVASAATQRAKQSSEIREIVAEKPPCNDSEVRDMTVLGIQNGMGLDRLRRHIAKEVRRCNGAGPNEFKQASLIKDAQTIVDEQKAKEVEQKRKQALEDAKAAAKGDGRTLIYAVPGDRHKAVMEIEKKLWQLNKYYRRGEELVVPMRARGTQKIAELNRDETSTITYVATLESVTADLDRYCKFLKPVRDNWIPTDTPQDYVRQVLSRPEHSPREVPYRELALVSNTPVLLPDGTVLTTGYRNAVLVLSDRAYPPVPENPTREDAIAALKKFEALFQYFPFVGADETTPWHQTPSYSAVLASMLSLAARSAVYTVPLFGVNAPTPGTGKSLIPEAVGMAMLGHKPTLVGYEGRDEFDKHLVPILRQQDRLVLIDNVSVPLRSDKFASILTNPVRKDRILSLSEDVTLYNRAVFFATGNNLMIDGDLGARRALQISLDSGLEHPEEREFSDPFNPVTRAQELHPELVTAALTALRAYIVAGKPKVLGRPPLGSFEEWDELVSGTLVWCGYADPVQTMREVRVNDPEREHRTGILESWYAEYGTEPVSLRQIGKKPISELKDALSDKDGFSIRSAPWKLRHLLNRPENGLKLVRVDSEHGIYQLINLDLVKHPLKSDLEEYFKTDSLPAAR